MPRCTARASVSFKMPKLSANGSGEAYHNWNKDQAMAPQKSTAPAIPPTLRPPRSTSATSCSRLALACCSAADSGDVVPMLDSLLCFRQVNNAPVWRLDCHTYTGRSEEHTSELQSLMRISY